MRTTILCCLAVLVSVPALAQDSRPTEKPSDAKRNWGLARPVVVKADYDVHGAKLSGLPYVTMTELAKDSKSWNGKKVQVRGDIKSVCPKKGCWMMVQDGDTTMRVKFTGYGFFVPLDATGRKAAAEGTVTVKVETEGERRHYAEDAGQSPEEIEKIKGDVTTLSFMADAVQIGKLPALPKKKDAKGGHGTGKGDGKGGGHGGRKGDG